MRISESGTYRSEEGGAEESVAEAEGAAGGVHDAGKRRRREGGVGCGRGWGWVEEGGE